MQLKQAKGEAEHDTGLPEEGIDESLEASCCSSHCLSANTLASPEEPCIETHLHLGIFKGRCGILGLYNISYPPCKKGLVRYGWLLADTRPYPFFTRRITNSSSAPPYLLRISFIWILTLTII